MTERRMTEDEWTAYWRGWNDACDTMISLSWWKRAYAELKRARLK